MLQILVIRLTTEKSKFVWVAILRRIKINVRGTLIILISNLIVFAEINKLDTYTYSQRKLKKQRA